MNLNKLTTETRNPKTFNIDELSVLETLQLMNEEDHYVAEAVKNELESIEKVVKQTIHCLKNDGRLIYVGAGTSGRIGILDAVECPPTFGMDPNKVVGLLAGGINQAFAKEEAEDSYDLGIEDMKNINLNENDILIGMAASGRTPYVIGALDYANSIHASTASITCNKGAEISKHANLVIEIDNGPEILTGSTRLKAGTSQKLVCNMISTVSMIGLGKVYENLMVDVDVSNEKLYQRWLNIVCVATGCEEDEAKTYYEPSHHNAKTAIVMILLGMDYETAKSSLERNDGFVKRVIKNEKKA